MRRALRPYALVLAFLAAQSAVIAIAPSRGPARVAVGGRSGVTAGAVAASDGGSVDGRGDSPASPESLRQPAAGSAPGTGPAARSREASNSPIRGGPVAAAPGDTGHCVPDISGAGGGLRQADPKVVFFAPPCVAKWKGADNGGATYAGVTGTEIKVIVWFDKIDPATQALLANASLAYRNRDHEKDVWNIYTAFINRRYELYGRKIKLEFYESSCTASPPDVPCLKDDAKNIAAKRPFAVMGDGTTNGLPPEAYDEFVRARIVSLGLHNAEHSFYADRRPYRWDYQMDGTEGAKHLAEYYCKKMAGKNASNTGRVIHPTIGSRDRVRRRVAFITSENVSLLAVTKQAAGWLSRCDGRQVRIYTQDNDVSRGQDQSAAIVASLIQDKITTVVPMDNLSPFYPSQVATKQGYFPEWLLPGGLGVLDYDTIGKVMDPQQWVHAFGPSSLAERLDWHQSDQAKVMAAMGRSDAMCNVCQEPWERISTVAWGIQMASPRLDPFSFERGMFVGWPRGGTVPGHPEYEKRRFGPDDYTGFSDNREVYWDPNAKSKIDGLPGRYVTLNNFRRYELGQWTSTFNVPPAAS